MEGSSASEGAKKKKKPAPKRQASNGRAVAAGPATPEKPKERRALDVEADPRLQSREVEYQEGFACHAQKRRLAIQEGIPALAYFLLQIPNGDMRKLHIKFRKAMVGLVADHSLSTSEFFDFLDLAPTPYMKSLLDAMVFEWADLDEDHQLSFSEFFLAATVVCTSTKKQLAFFVFALFDQNDDHRLDREEIVAISEAVAAATFGGTSKNFLEVCETLMKDKNALTFPLFLEAIEHSPHVIHPALELQHLFITKTLGRPAWDKIRHGFTARHGDAPEEGSFHKQVMDAGLRLIGNHQVFRAKHL